MPVQEHPDLLVGTATSDDAAVWKNPDGSLTISTVDAFTPIVDDPYLYGKIAAANAASDVYAMGGAPKFGLNIVVWPQKILGLDILQEVLMGGNDAAAEGGWLIVGGHTIDGVEPIYGQSITGHCTKQNLLTNSNGQAGQALILTKPLGTGIISTAVKASQTSKVLDIAYKEAIAEMQRLNNEAADVAKQAQATAATDITGFGLLGHLHKLALASGVAAVIQASEIPMFTDVLELIEYSPGGAQKNLDFVEDFIDKTTISENLLKLAADPQTSGGLLFSCPEENAEYGIHKLNEKGHRAAIIGNLMNTSKPGSLIFS